MSPINRNRRRSRTARHGLPPSAAITIRHAYGDDQSALHRLAALDSAAIPEYPVLVAEVDGELRAAISLRDASSIADPFFPTLQLVDLLRAYASASAPEPQRRRRRRHAVTYA